VLFDNHVQGLYFSGLNDTQKKSL